MSDELLGGRYRLDTVLGRGGMAAVWRGVDTRLDRPVAVKILDGAALIEPAAVERFHREARTVARLTDPHVVSVYDVGSDGDRHYLVMELVEGSNLAALLAAGPLPVARAAGIAAQICEALGAAHAAGVVHRDVKPGNILIDPKGTVKVCDFGIARLAGAAQPTLTAVGAVIGTSQYMAPEQVSGGPVDAHTDLYALGCVLYAMLTGAPPFEGDAPLGVAWQQLHREPEPVAARRPEVPGPLAALVDRLLAKNPADRPGSAAEVRAALARLAVAGASAAGGAARDPATAIVRGRPESAAAARATAAVVAHNRAMPLIEDDVPLPPERGGRSPWAVLAAVAAAGVVLVGLFFLVPDIRPDQEQSAGGPGGTSAPPAASTAPATPKATEPVDTPDGGRIADRLGAFRQAFADAVAAGRIDPKTAEEISKEFDKIEKEVAEGDTDKVVEKTTDVVRKLAKLRREGKITRDDWEAMSPALGGFSVDLPSVEFGEDD